MRKKIELFLLAVIIAVFAWTIFTNRSVYLTPYDPGYWQDRYENSQWVKGYEATEVMGDAELYTYAGWRQVHGDDPTKINTEMPPFGKYLLGLSVLVFRNANVQAPIFGVLFLLVSFFWAKRVLKETAWALLPVMMITVEPLFRADLTTSMLDLPFALFVALAFFFLTKGRDNPCYYLFLTLSLAAVSTIKIYQVGFALTAVFGLYLLFLLIAYHYKDIFWFIVFLPVFVVFYFANYLVYFLSGRDLLDFKELHFWIRYFGRVHVDGYPKGEILRIFFLGGWKTWWGGSGVISVAEWRPWWVLGFLTIPLSVWLGFFKKNLDLLILSFWPISFLAMYTYGVPYPRYVFAITLPLYILLTYNLKLGWERWKK